MATRALVSYPGSGNTWIRYLLGFYDDDDNDNDDNDNDDTDNENDENDADEEDSRITSIATSMVFQSILEGVGRGAKQSLF